MARAPDRDPRLSASTLAQFSNLIEDELAAKNESFIVVWGQGMADCGKANCMGGGTYPERAWCG